MFELLESLPILDGSKEKRISVYHGNLAAIPPPHSLDLLVISAFPNGYHPSSKSLIGALGTIGLSIEQLSKHKLIDLRSVCNFWLSEKLSEKYPTSHIDQIACFESAWRGAPPELVGNLFRGLFPFLNSDKEAIVGMPLLAAGDQGYSAEKMFDAIINAASHWMSRGLSIKELKIVILEKRLAADMASRLASVDLGDILPLNKQKGSYDVFLSFSKNDQAAADITKQALLERNDVKAIFDYRLEIDKGVSWQSKIDEAILSSNAIVAITSPSYFASPECQEELSQARLRHKRDGGSRLFPINWKSTENDLALWLQTINMSDCREENSDKLKKEVRQLRFR